MRPASARTGDAQPDRQRHGGASPSAHLPRAQTLTSRYRSIARRASTSADRAYPPFSAPWHRGPGLSGGGRDRPETAPSARRKRLANRGPWARRPPGPAWQSGADRRCRRLGVAPAAASGTPPNVPHSAPGHLEQTIRDPGRSPGLPHRWPDARGARTAVHGRHARYRCSGTGSLDWVTSVPASCARSTHHDPHRVLPLGVRVRFHRSTARVRMMSLGSCGPRATTRPLSRRPLVPSVRQESTPGRARDSAHWRPASGPPRRRDGGAGTAALARSGA